MKFDGTREQLIKEIQKEFNKTYPFLKIEFFKKEERTWKRDQDRDGQDPPAGENAKEGARGLGDEVGWSDSMTVSELEKILQDRFGLPVQVFRKSGNLWLETTMSHSWTLRQQNDHGEEITSFK